MKMNEIAGIGNWNTAEFWEYATRSAHRANPDPVVNPSLSPYAVFDGNPIWYSDPLGNTPGDYYASDGSHLGSDGKKDNKTYIASGKKTTEVKDDKGIVKESKTEFTDAKELPMGHDKFQKMAATSYAESSVGYGVKDAKEVFAIASVHVNKNKKAYGEDAPLARSFLSTPVSKRNGSFMQVANAAMVNALTGGPDYSNGANQWDGAEQAMLGNSNMGQASNGRFMFKMNVMGWSIKDNHFQSWKSAVDQKFGKGKFTVPQQKAALHNYQGMHNKGKIRLNSTAQYGLSIFWTEK